MLKHADCLLVIAEQALLRAVIARLLRPLGFRVEIASTEKRARQLIGQGQLTGAVVAPTGLIVAESAFLRELQAAVPKLVLLANDPNEAKRLAASFPEAMVCGSEPLEHGKLLAFLTEPAPRPSDSASATEFLHFAGRRLDVAGRIFLDAEQREVPLTRGEFALLVAFARNSGRVLSRAQLRNGMNGGSADSYDRSVDMLVARLRRKIEPQPTKPQFILTVAGIGYKFAPSVRRSETATTAVSASEDQVSGEPKAPRAERRQVTVLSCQILGFAALAAKLDPEDLDKTVGPVYAACAEVMARFGGTMVRTFGDGVLAYFGYPKAQENDAASAVRAALELLRTIRGVEAAPIGNFRTRIGIATGLMVMGELSSIGGRDAGGMGEALNLALHMQKAAPAHGVVIAAGTRNLIGRFFHCREIAAVEMEEGDEPVPAWYVVDEVAGMPRFEALHREGMLELVGRRAEIARLRQCWSRVLGGSGQVALLTGEAGIGKSRLLIELQERLRDELHAVIRFSGSPQRVDAPMSVLVEELQRSAGFTTSDATSQKVQKLQGEFAGLGPGAKEAVALGCTLLGLPFDASPPVNQLSPQKRKERTFAALLARIEALSARQPVLVVLEDAHWIDPTSLEFFALLVERASAMRVLLLIVARPEFVPPWPEYFYLTTLALPRLSRADAALLIEQVAGERCIPASVAADILTRGDGVPLFVEELAKSLLETSANGGNGGVLGSKSMHPAPIPSTLHGLLLARFDRLDEGKAMAQAGAVVGREFSFELLRMITAIDEPVLLRALDELVNSGLAFRRGAPPQATYVFKHALVRDAAYSMLVRLQRQMLHAGVARSYEENFPEVVESQPELLAYHHREAGSPIKAIGYLITAAERALGRSAVTEALAQLALVRELIASLPANEERLEFELKQEITLGRALIEQRGYTAPETREAYRRARAQCEALGNQDWLPLIILGQWVGAWSAADHQAALKEAQELYHWGERNAEPPGMAVADLAFGMTLTPLGDLLQARRHLEHGLQINQFVLPRRQPFLASDTDGRISSLSYLHDCLLLLGYPDQAKAIGNQAAALQPQQLYSRALAQIHLLRMHVFERDAARAAEVGTSVLRLSREQGYPYFIGTSMVYTGWALSQGGDHAGGIELCRDGLAQLRAIGAKCWWPRYLSLSAECYEQAGKFEHAAQSIDEAIESVGTTRERVWEPEIYRLKAKFLLCGGHTQGAEECFALAMSKAKELKAKLLELRAAVGLAELFRRTRREGEARELLASIYTSFTEGFNFIDLCEAKVELDRLTAPSSALPGVQQMRKRRTNKT